jgi:hypothetical protein
VVRVPACGCAPVVVLVFIEASFVPLVVVLVFCAETFVQVVIVSRATAPQYESFFTGILLQSLMNKTSAFVSKVRVMLHPSDCI